MRAWHLPRGHLWYPPAVSADQTSVVSADMTSVVSVDKTSVVSADISQDILPTFCTEGRPRSGRHCVENAWGMSWEMSADTMTQQMSCLLTQQVSCLQTQQMSCLQTHQLLEIPQPGFARFGTSETESGHHLDISGDLPAKILRGILTR